MTRDRRPAPGRSTLSDEPSSAARPGRGGPAPGATTRVATAARLSGASVPGRTSLVSPSLEAPAADSAEVSGAPADSGGAALPDAVRAPLERAFGTDFSGVRVHEGHQATALGALAFTRGSDIHFAPGRYQPASAGGRALLGHELAHVVQQAQGRVGASGALDGVPLNADASLEHEADVLGARASAGERIDQPAVSGARTNNVVQRVTAEEIADLVTPDLGARDAVIQLMNDWLQAGYRMPLSSLSREAAVSLWPSFHRWFWNQKRVPRPYTGGVHAYWKEPGVIDVVLADNKDEDVATNNNAASALSTPSSNDNASGKTDAMEQAGHGHGLSSEEQDIARCLAGGVTRSENGTGGVFFAGPYAIKPDGGEVHAAIQLGEALTVPQPSPSHCVPATHQLAALIRTQLERAGAKLDEHKQTGFVIMRKIDGADFSSLEPKHIAMLDDPKLVADIGKLWTFLNLINSTDDVFGENNSNLMLQAAPTRALIGVDAQVDDIIEPEQTGKWIRRLAKNLRDRGLPKSLINDLAEQMTTLGVGKTVPSRHKVLLRGVVEVLDAGLHAAQDNAVRQRVGAEGRQVLDAIAKRPNAIAYLRGFSE